MHAVTDFTDCLLLSSELLSLGTAELGLSAGEETDFSSGEETDFSSGEEIGFSSGEETGLSSGEETGLSSGELCAGLLLVKEAGLSPSSESLTGCWCPCLVLVLLKALLCLTLFCTSFGPPPALPCFVGPPPALPCFGPPPTLPCSETFVLSSLLDGPQDVELSFTCSSTTK